jgi:radical SAM protein with 4Fe4S-binding SPASM domain
MSAPYSVFLEVTNACNSSCIHCRTRVGNPLRNELSTVELFNIMDTVRHMGTKFLTFTGGEPLLRQDILELISYSCDLGMNTLLATNGFLLTPEKIKFLAGLKNLSVQISLDGASAPTHDLFRGLKGSFGRAIYGLERCVESEIHVNASMTLTKYNLENLSGVIDIVRGLGVPVIKLRRFIPAGQGFENSSRLDLTSEEVKSAIEFYISKRAALCQEVELQMEQAPFSILSSKDKPTVLADTTKRIQGGCSAGSAICVIDPVGNVRPCPSLAVNVGNIRYVSFETIWHTSHVLNILRDRSNLLGCCGVCEYRNICGGCRAGAFSEFGNYLAEDPKCWYAEILKARGCKFADKYTVTAKA